MNTVLWGASGQAIVLRELLEANGDTVIALFDNDTATRSPLEGVPLYYGIAGFNAWTLNRRVEDVQGLAAIGGGRGADRIEVHALFVERGIRIARAIHRTAFVSGDASVGAGAQVMAHATVGARAIVGDATLINTAASIDHECLLERGVHVGPGAVLAGCVEIGEFAFVGAGAVVLPRVRVGRRSTVGAGSVVTKDVPPDMIVAGNPARPHHALESRRR